MKQAGRPGRLLLTSFMTLLIAAPASALSSAPASALSSAPAPDFGSALSQAAIERTTRQVAYDGAYQRLAYPGGDVSPDRGVCTDLVIRALRTLGVDLQKLVHEDMMRAFDAYPNHWDMSAPDANIDHRRAPNLEMFFSRQGAALAISGDPADYWPGDIVAWNLRGDSGWLPHIGIVTDRPGASGTPMIAHNIGAGPQLEDVLFNWKITGHYRLNAGMAVEVE